PLTEIGSQDLHAPALALLFRRGALVGRLAFLRRPGVSLVFRSLVVSVAAHAHHTFSILAPARSRPGETGRDNARARTRRDPPDRGTWHRTGPHSRSPRATPSAREPPGASAGRASSPASSTARAERPDRSRSRPASCGPSCRRARRC